jgi:hypothetical protein
VLFDFYLLSLLQNVVAGLNKFSSRAAQVPGGFARSQNLCSGMTGSSPLRVVPPSPKCNAGEKFDPMKHP